jgi:NADH dehydrogenase
VIFGERDRFMNMFAGLQTVLPLMPLASADARFQPVWVEDVARAVARSLDDRTTVGLTIECTGPRVYTLRELVELAGQWSGSRRPVLALPALFGRLQAMLLEWLPGLERLGIEPTPLESVAPGYLGHAGGERRLEAWRARARRS